MHARPRRTDRWTNNMAIARRFVLWTHRALTVSQYHKAPYITWRKSHYYTLCLKKIPTFKLSVTLRHSVYRLNNKRAAYRVGYRGLTPTQHNTQRRMECTSAFSVSTTWHHHADRSAWFGRRRACLHCDNLCIWVPVYLRSDRVNFVRNCPSCIRRLQQKRVESVHISTNGFVSSFLL